MKILIAEDDTTSRRILETVLSKSGFEVISTKNGRDAWEMLQETDAPRLAVLDWMMPEIDGAEICRRVREREKGKERYTYLILLTARNAREDIVAGMESGADDYVVKPFDHHELRVRIRAGQRITELQSDLIATKQELLTLSRTDALTGVLNRRAILSRISTELSRASREGTPISLSMLDIDHFKQVNDTYGHLAGDTVLRECTKRIRSALRQYDSLGRFGGEEFLVVVPGVEKELAVAVSERIRSAIADADFRVDGTPIQITVSQGVVAWDGVATVDRLVAAADKALYRAKENGRNRVELGELDAEG